MASYRELVFMCLDELKLVSDDSYYTEDHIIFLLSKYRGLLLEQKYKDIKKEIPESNFQTLCIDLETTPAISGDLCEGGMYLKSTVKVPSSISISPLRIYSGDMFGTEISFISNERMRYVGHNKWLQNTIYAAIGSDNYLYFKSNNPQYLHLKKVTVSGVFENPEEAAKYECTEGGSTICDVLDSTFPIEEALIPQIIQMVVKELSGAVYRPKDEQNNANDDLSNIASFIRSNMKSQFQKQMEG